MARTFRGRVKGRTRKSFTHLNIDGLKRIIPKIAEEVLSKKRIIRPIFEEVKNQILDNAEKRFLSAFRGVGSRRGVNVLQAMRNASGLRVTKDKITIDIARKNEMDMATRLPPTKAEGRTYTLWSLLREGWGRRGGKRPDDYVLAVYISGLGVVPPKMNFVRAIENEGIQEGRNRYNFYGTIHILMKHPGMKGRDWLTVVGRPYDEDFEILSKGAKKVVRSINKSFNSTRLLRVAS